MTFHHPECNQAVSCMCEDGHKEVKLKARMDLAVIETGTRSKEVIQVDVPRTMYDEVRKVPGSTYASKQDTWILPLTWPTCIIMRGIFGGDLEVSPELAEWSHEERRNRVNKAMEWRDWRDISFPSAFKGEDMVLRPYQKVSAAFMALNKSAINGDDMRVGKTGATIRALRKLQSDGELTLPALIVVPPRVKAVWREGLKAWWPSAKVIVPKSGLAASEKAIREEPDILVMHYEVVPMLSKLQGWGSERLLLCKDCLPMVSEKGEEVPNKIQPSRCQVHSKPMNEVKWNSIVCDEVHRIGEASALMTRAVKKIRETANVAFGLTGTMPEEPDRFWSIMNFVAPSEYPSKSKFLDRYAIMEPDPWSGFMKSVGWRKEMKPELDKFWQPRFIRRPKRAVLDVVEPEKFIVECEMTPKQAKAYKDLKTMLMAELDGGIFWVDNPGSKMQRLRQLASAYGELLEDNKMVLSEPSSKLDALEDRLSVMGTDPVVIFAEQAQLIELAAARLGDRAVKLVGGMSDTAAENSINAFMGGDVQFILSTAATGGEGISLNVADTLFYLQRPWSRVLNKQTEERIFMEGRASFFFDFITPGTVEEKVPVSLAEKDAKFETLVMDEETVRKWLS